MSNLSPQAHDPATASKRAELRRQSRKLARRALRKVNTEPVEPMLQIAVWVAGNLLGQLTHQEWQGGEHIPKTGGAIFVVNHIGNADPVAFGQFLAWHGRYPRFLAKEQIFAVPVLGWIARKAGQIMVVRNTPQAKEAALTAEAALRAGKSISIYPEGTITKDPLMWPMTAKTGAVRMALDTGAPIIPVAQWGAQEIVGGAKLQRPDLFPKKTMQVKAGPPINIDDLRDKPVTEAVLAEGTDRILDTLTTMVAELRGEEPPATRWNYKLARREEPTPEQHETGQLETPDVEPRDG